MKQTIVLLLAVHVSGCSILAPWSQQVTISSDPAGADVVVNGEFVGATPVQISVPRRSRNAILVSKKGYRSSRRKTSVEMSTLGIVDTIGGIIWLVPFIGLAFPGAWQQAEENIAVVLRPEEKPPTDTPTGQKGAGGR